jgi:hypothetical protein
LTRFDPSMHSASGAGNRVRTGGGGGGGGGDDLSGLDWVLIVLCPFIALILGIVRAAQGKGSKMLIAAAISFAIHATISVVKMSSRAS